MKSKPDKTTAYKRYQLGRTFNERIGYYSTVNENIDMYNGDQWEGKSGIENHKPVFNIERRVGEYEVAAIMAQKVKAIYSFDNVGDLFEQEGDELLHTAARIMTANAEREWEKQKMDSKIRQVLEDGFVTGDMCAYVYWDADAPTGQDYKGNFRTELVDGGNVFFGDVNSWEVEKQPYIVILSRETVQALKAEAKRNGIPQDEINLIGSDYDVDTQHGKYGQQELDGDDDASKKCNAYIMFWKGEDGYVRFSKSTNFARIKPETNMGIKRYPIAWSNYIRRKNCYHGIAKCTSIHPNQRYINTMFAMCNIWMKYNAFGKVAYDATRITGGWTNEIGVAIPVQGSTDGIVQQLRSGDFNNAVLETINMAIKYTKDFLGATDAALGEMRADNTSAIIAVQKSSAIPLESVQHRLYQFVEDIYLIWADFMIENYIAGRRIPSVIDGKTVYIEFPDIEAYKDKISLSANIEVGASSYWDEIREMQTLDNAVQLGIITPLQYFKRLPAGAMRDVQSLIEELEGQSEEPQGDGSMTDESDLEEMATWLDQQPKAVQVELRSMPPEQMQAEVVRRMSEQAQVQQQAVQGASLEDMIAQLGGGSGG